MAIHKLIVAELGLASLFASASNIDWSEARGEDFDGIEIILPTLTLGAIAERAPDLLSKKLTKRAETYPGEEAPEDIVDAFEDSNGYYEWKDGFEPMMSYVWPAFLPYRLSAQALANRLDEFAPVISLIHFGDDSAYSDEAYGFALSGGGMNLADQIAAAYLCAEQVPPLRLLESLAGVIGPGMRGRIGEPLREAYAKAAEHLRYKAEVMEREVDRVFKEEGTPA